MNTYTPAYVPQTYTTGTIAPTTIITPTGPVPQALPSSAGMNIAPKQKKSFSASLKNAWESLTAKAERTWNEQTDLRFRKYFGLPYTELLYGEFWGEVYTGGHLQACSVYLSTNWLCIESKMKDPVTRAKLQLKAQFMLRDILRIQRAVALPSLRGGPPIIQAVNDPSAAADSVIIYTRDGQIHQFARFYNYAKFVATLEYMWQLSASANNQTGVQTSTSQVQASAPTYLAQASVQPNIIPLHTPSLTKEYIPAQTIPVNQSGTPYR